MDKRKRTKGQTTICKRKSTKGQTPDLQNIHIKLKIEQHEPHYKLGVNSDVQGGDNQGELRCSEWKGVHVPLMAPVVLI
jgi:hypothetical protein